MIIDTRSWHYRIQRYSGQALASDWTPPRSLCAYFWRLMLAPVLCFAALLVRGASAVFPWAPRGEGLFVTLAFVWTCAAGMAVGCLFVPGFDPEGRWGTLAHALLFFPAIAMAGLAASFLAVSGIVTPYCWVLRRSEQPPSLLVERVKAWKTGVCPLIEYRDTEASHHD